MELSRETIKREIAGAGAAIEAHEEGALVNKIVLEAFEMELKKLPKEEEKKKKIPRGVN